MVTMDCCAWYCYQFHYLFSWHRGGNLVNLRWKSFSEKDGFCPVDRTSELEQNKKAFQSNANCPLARRRTGYIVKKLEHVWWLGVSVWWEGTARAGTGEVRRGTQVLQWGPLLHLQTKGQAHTAENITLLWRAVMINTHLHAQWLHVVE